jgi:hypothetical protein
MTYAITTQTPASPEQFEEIDALIGDEPVAGLLARYTGVTDAGVAVTSLWASKADADRFFVERLRSAIEQVAGSADGGPQPSISFDVTHEMLPAGR